jgi:HlyD family type I secretion membrane fusion protein
MSKTDLLSLESGTLPQAQPADLLAVHLREAQGLVRLGCWVLGLCVVPAVAWLTLAPLASAVVAPGVVKVDMNRRTLQHAEGGTVSRVHVRDGQKVRAGEPLVELGDVAVSADRVRLQHRLLAEQAGALRLESEQVRRDLLAWPVFLQEAARREGSLAEHLRKEQALFAARRDALLSQTRLLRDQRATIDQEFVSLRVQIGKADESLAAQQRELDSHRSLAKDGFIAPTRVMQLEASVADYGVKLAERRGELVRAQQRMLDIDLKLRTLDNDYRQQASDQLKVATVRIQELEQELRKASDALSRQVISSPVDGEVVNLKATHAGMVLAPREPVLDVVPVNPRLLVEAHIRTEDVGRVHQGQRADLRFTAYQYRTSHLVPGTVHYISADRLVEPQTQQPYYTVQITVERDAVSRAIAGAELQAGMPAEVYLQGEARSPLQYLVEPVTQVLRHAGRER